MTGNEIDRWSGMTRQELIQGKAAALSAEIAIRSPLSPRALLDIYRRCLELVECTPAEIEAAMAAMRKVMPTDL